VRSAGAPLLPALPAGLRSARAGAASWAWWWPHVLVFSGILLFVRQATYEERNRTW